MRKIITLSALGMMLASSLQAQSWDWAEEIATLNPEVVDSVIPIMNPEEKYKWYQSCMIYYHQPLQHDNPSLGNISLRAVLSVYSFEQFKDRMVQMFINGYKLEDLVINEPNTQYDNANYSAEGEITYHYDGNLLRPEHRFFGTSVPENPMDKLDYCNAKEAAADFHALAEAVKKVFKGKWVISGVSKGGMCAAIQHAYYPDDADCFVPYVAPIMTSNTDMRIQDRSMTEPWTPEMRDQMQNLVSKILNSPGVYSYYEKYKSFGPENGNECRCLFLADAYDVIAYSQQKLTRSLLSEIYADNQAYLQKNGLDDYTDAMLAFFCTNPLKFTKLSRDFENWKIGNWVEESLSKSSSADDENDFSEEDDDDSSLDNSISASTFSNGNFGFYYQSLRELGYYGLKWDYFYDTQIKIDSVNTLWQSQTTNPIALHFGHLFDNLEYNPELMNFVRQQTASTTKPLIYIYGGDDFWTGGRIQDEYINGENVRLYILPEQNHDACLYRMTDTEKQDEIWAFLDAIFKATPDAIEQIEQRPAKGDKTRYNLMGQPADKAQGLSVEDGRVIFRK